MPMSTQRIAPVRNPPPTLFFFLFVKEKMEKTKKQKKKTKGNINVIFLLRRYCKPSETSATVCCDTRMNE
jgi:hypothetical protein